MNTGRPSNLTLGSKLRGGNPETTNSRLLPETNAALPVDIAAETSDIEPLGEAAVVNETLPCRRRN
jgi:hypothetical protein